MTDNAPYMIIAPSDLRLLLGGVSAIWLGVVVLGCWLSWRNGIVVGQIRTIGRGDHVRRGA